MNLLLTTFIITSSLLAIAFLAIRKRKIRTARWASILLCLQAIFVLSIGMSGLRVHVKHAHSQGASQEFIKGMVERDWFFFWPRIAAGTAVVGLTIVTAFAVSRNQSKSKKKEKQDSVDDDTPLS